MSDVEDATEEERIDFAEAGSAEQIRESRDQDTRETEIQVENWSQPDILPMPKAEDGYVFRWVRTSIYGQEDNRNVSMRFREGWKPVKLADHPDLMIVPDYGSAWGKQGNVEIGGLLLCKAPQRLMDQRRKHFEDQANSQLRAIDSNLMKEADPRMPILAPDRTTKVSFGS